MDKLRALHYFVAAAAAGSLSGAARKLDVSMPAVLKLINALERDLGATLFERSSRGLGLTAEGARYLERCVPLLEELDEAGNCLAPASGARGVVVVGIAPFEQHCLRAALPRFHARFPEIELDVRPMRRVTESQAAAMDVFVMSGWQKAPDLVCRVVAHTPYRIVATPAYWSRRGAPRHPRDLANHECLVFRSAVTALDVWDFERGEERESVTVAGWLVTGCRELLLEATLSDAGVMRARELTARPYLRTGRLVAALQDWEAPHAPPVAVMFRPKHRRTPRIRAFVDFVTETFRGLEPERDATWPVAKSAPPAWWAKEPARVSRAMRGTPLRSTSASGK